MQKLYMVFVACDHNDGRQQKKHKASHRLEAAAQQHSDRFERAAQLKTERGTSIFIREQPRRTPEFAAEGHLGNAIIGCARPVSSACAS